MSPESLTSQADSLPAEPLGKHHCAPHISYSESEEQLNSLLMKVKEESEKAGLKISSTKLRSWYPVLSLHGRQMGKKWKQWKIFFYWDPKSLQTVTEAMKLKDTCFLEEKL